MPIALYALIALVGFTFAPNPIFAAALWTVPDASYAGDEKCAVCHEETTRAFAATKMGKIFLTAPRDELEKLACENCHGPGSKHIEDPSAPDQILRFGKGSNAPIDVRNEACLQCHRKGGSTFWEESLHQKHGLACSDCHSVKRETESRSQLAAAEEKTPFGARRAETETCLRCHAQQRARMMRSSHMPLREGKMTCSDCHNPHGSMGPAMLTANSVVESCTSCHAEKRGPFLWEHPPVRERCTACHDPHGSIHPNLLTAKQPRLCQQCHIESRHPTQPHAPNNAFVLSQSCLNCHPQIHGSNHPSGARLMR